MNASSSMEHCSSTAQQLCGGGGGVPPATTVVHQAAPASFDNLSFIVPFVVGVAGYIAQVLYSWFETRRQFRLERISRQIRDLYGPLQALNESGNIAWKAFLRECPGGTKQNPEAWRKWFRVVFWDIAMQRRKLIMENFDLIEGDSSFPECFQVMIARNDCWKVIMEEWDQGDFARLEPDIAWDDACDRFTGHVHDTYMRLREEQAKLLNPFDSWLGARATSHAAAVVSRPLPITVGAQPTSGSQSSSSSHAPLDPSHVHDLTDWADAPDIRNALNISDVRARRGTDADGDKPASRVDRLHTADVANKPGKWFGDWRSYTGSLTGQSWGIKGN